MSKPIQAINRYKADLRELQFLLFEQFRIDELLGKAPFDGLGPGRVPLDADRVLPLGPRGHRPAQRGRRRRGLQGGGRQRRHAARASRQPGRACTRRAGSRSPSTHEYGGAGAPHSLQVLIEEMISGANTAFAMYAGLAFGASEVIESFGTPEQKHLYCARMFGGQWGGTMCLTEPQAGSDVGSAKTTATRNADGSYTIRGTKIFISGGDHDLAENIVHLVLARVDGAPAGTKGLTLFIVPKIRAAQDGALGESNDVTVANIEHKMGINGSATCILNFGDAGKCIGWPVGGESKLNQGMPQMFKLMNSARIAVGRAGHQRRVERVPQRARVRQGAQAGLRHHALEGRDRAARPHHRARRRAPDAARHEGARRRHPRARGEARRTTRTRCARSTGKDEQKVAYHQGQVDLLVPLVKAYGSDQGFRVCETAIQTYGGAGYTRDYPVEQYCRDAKIFSIYEGTNHIQAMDLVGRKLGPGGRREPPGVPRATSGSSCRSTRATRRSAPR